MKIAIVRQPPLDGKPGRILTVRDYGDIDGRGELAHLMAELESIKLDLMDMWENLDFDDDGEDEVIEFGTGQ